MSAWDDQISGDHYKKMKIQPMEYSMENNLNALQFSIIKYISRYKDKHGIEDLKKAKHCVQMLLDWENAHVDTPELTTSKGVQTEPDTSLLLSQLRSRLSGTHVVDNPDLADVVSTKEISKPDPVPDNPMHDPLYGRGAASAIPNKDGPKVLESLSNWKDNGKN